MGFSDAAELFVLLAGVSSALAYGNHPQSDAMILKRAGQIYLAHLALVLLVAALIAAAALLSGENSLLHNAAVAPFVIDPLAAFTRTVSLQLQPEFIDILPLYLMLLLWLPALLRLGRYSRKLTLVVAIVIWITSIALQINLPGPRQGGWFFNPFAWQLIFSIGVIIGLREAKAKGETRLPRYRLMLIFAIGFLAFSFVLSAPWAQLPIMEVREFRLLPPDLVGYVSKTYLSPWRVTHVLCLTYVTAWYVPRDSNWLNSPLGVGLRGLGRKPLTMFMLASLSSYAAGVVFILYGKGLLLQICSNLVGLALLATLGNARGHSRTRSSCEERLAHRAETSRGSALA